jgi:hypothetical protein
MGSRCDTESTRPPDLHGDDPVGVTVGPRRALENGVYQGGVENPSAGWDPGKNQGQNPNPKAPASFNDANGAPVQPGAFTHTPGAGWTPQ